uniref:Transposase Tc1-like domain-containing protein n=1 Tax=Mola mola TaxID=94237 RepID=A0A3Q3W1M3_MOLML
MRSQSAVCKVLKHHRGEDHLMSQKSPGQPQLTTRRDDRQLLNLCRRNWKKTGSRLRHLLRRHHGINVSCQTVHRRLLQHGYQDRRITKCPRLTVRRRVAQLRWAREHRWLQLGQCRHFVFMDESCYILDRIDGRQRMWRLRGENLPDDCIQETTPGGGGSVMVSARFHYGGETPLVVLDENVKSFVCWDILENHCLPHARKVYWNNFRLQDYNTRAHRVAAVREFLDAEGVQPVPWPAFSPDTNPIERTIFLSLQEFDWNLTEKWDALPIDDINKLVDSMP